MPIQSRKMFVDSSVLYAFVDRTDKNHPRTVKTLEDLARVGCHLYTSSLSINDTFLALSREVGFAVALEFLEAMNQSEVEILFPQKADLVSAFRALKSNREHQISLKEALNAVMMQKKDITHIITFTYWHNLFGTRPSTLAF